jgi:hypothetical protein
MNQQLITRDLVSNEELDQVDRLLERAKIPAGTSENGEGQAQPESIRDAGLADSGAGTEFVEGLHIDAICSHLQAVTEGRIRNLIINVPPGHAKSLLTGVFWRLGMGRAPRIPMVVQQLP